MNKKVSFALKISVTIVGLGLIFILLRNKLDEVFGIIRNCNILIFIYALLTYAIVNIFAAARLKVVFFMQQIKKSLWRTWKLFFIGYFFNLFLPSSVGGDIAKGYYAYKYSGEKDRAFLSVIIDRIIGLFSLVFLSTVAVSIFYTRINNPVVLIIVLLMFAASILILLFFTFKRFASLFKFLQLPFLPKKLFVKIHQLYLLVYECKKHKRLASIAFLYSIVFQLITISTNYILAQAMNIPISLGTFFIFIPLVYIFSLFPSINGLGVREGAYIYFCSYFTSTENAFALALMADVLLYSCSIIGLILYMFHKDVTYKEIKTTSMKLDDVEITE